MWILLCFFLLNDACQAPEVLAHHREGVRHFSYYDFHGAADAFWAAWKAGPECEPAVINFVIACLHSGRLHEAETQLKRLERGRPEDPRILYLQGILLLRQGREGDALRYFEQVRELDPGDPATLGQLALIAFHAGEFQKSLDYLEEARRLDSEDPSLIYSEARARLQLGQREKAQELFTLFRERKKVTKKPMPGGMGEPSVVPGKYAELICIDPKRLAEEGERHEENHLP
ncbi:MAG: hypothetical protein Kow00109_03970 [Acidobacteriota bacterium]